MVFPIVHIFDIISLFAGELEEPKIGIWGKGLRYYISHLTFYHNILTYSNPENIVWTGEKPDSEQLNIVFILFQRESSLILFTWNN